MLERLLYADLLNWRLKPERKPVLLDGARQVGKTWLVENVLAKEFENVAKIDLEKRRDLHVYFAETLDQAISIHYNLHVSECNI